MAVTGLVKPGLQVTNAGGKPGDLLYLTKPLGIGIATSELALELTARWMRRSTSRTESR